MVPLVVIDTNVLVSAFRSRLGKAFQLVERIGKGEFEIAVSVPLVLEYEAVLLRETTLTEPEVHTVLAYLCSVAHQQRVFFLWRPMLRDGKDDMVLELAVAARARVIVTFNQRDFAGSERFGIEALAPQEFLKRIRGDSDGNPEP